MPEPKLEHQAKRIRDLIADYRAGRIVIPEFQREYVWKRSKAPWLIDSLYKGFPISSLLLWVTSEETRARRPEPRPSRGVAMSWLIDGQQRVITLSRSMYGDQGIDIVFNPDKQEFTSANAATKRDRNWYRLAEIWDDDEYRQLRKNLPEGPRGAVREERLDKVRRVLDYEVPVVRMVDHSFDNAVDAFTRINTLGVRLKREDIESAKVAARHTGFIADHVGPFLDQVQRQGFSRLNVMHLFRACAFVAQPDGRDRTPLHELKQGEVQAAWAHTKRATVEAIALVRSEFGLINMDILWSGALLVPVIAHCATRPPRERDVQGMAGWLAVAALLHRYSKSTETALDKDLKACRSSDPVGALLTNARRDEGKGGITAIPDDFSGALADKSGLFAMYVACHHRGLKDLFSGGKIIHQATVDRHHILPRAQFPERRRQVADSIANIAFISGGANRSISSSAPEVYLAKLNKEVLESQCIPLESDLWRIDRAKEFWDARRALLADAFNDYIKNVLPGRRA
jgi:hypothetical protein